MHKEQTNRQTFFFIYIDAQPVFEGYKELNRIQIRMVKSILVEIYLHQFCKFKYYIECFFILFKGRQ
jgi:hypothetical protein